MNEEPKPHLKPYHWQPGQSGNPAGRPKGSKQKLATDFIKALHDDFAKHGIQVIETVRENKPEEYLKVVSRMVPAEFHVNHSTDELTDEQLIERARVLSELLGPFAGVRGDRGSDPDAAQAQSTH